MPILLSPLVLLLLLLLLLRFSGATSCVRAMAALGIRYPMPNSLGSEYSVHIALGEPLSAAASRVCLELADSLEKPLTHLVDDPSLFPGSPPSTVYQTFEEWMVELERSLNPAACTKQFVRHFCEFETTRSDTPEAVLAFLSQIRPLRYIHIGAHVARDFLHPLRRSCGKAGENEGLIVEPNPSVFKKIDKNAPNSYENAAICKTSGEVEFFTVGTNVDPEEIRDGQTGRHLPCYDAITQVKRASALHRIATCLFPSRSPPQPDRGLLRWQISSMSRDHVLKHFDAMCNIARNATGHVSRELGSAPIRADDFIRVSSVPCLSVRDLLAKHPRFAPPELDAVIIDAEGADLDVLLQFDLRAASVVTPGLDPQCHS
jgi:hypothetical protein